MSTPELGPINYGQLQTSLHHHSCRYTYKYCTYPWVLHVDMFQRRVSVCQSPEQWQRVDVCNGQYPQLTHFQTTSSWQTLHALPQHQTVAKLQLQTIPLNMYPIDQHSRHWLRERECGGQPRIPLWRTRWRLDCSRLLYTDHELRCEYAPTANTHTSLLHSPATHPQLHRNRLVRDTHWLDSPCTLKPCHWLVASHSLQHNHVWATGTRTILRWTESRFTS